MNNPRISKKERGLLKGAIRRVFSRSDLRREVLNAAEIDHKDPKRPRVTKWVRCFKCKEPTPKYKAVVDHRDPLVPIHTALEDMSWDEVINRAWCDKNNLDILDQECHNIKTKQENKQRREIKKGKKIK